MLSGDHRSPGNRYIDQSLRQGRSTTTIQVGGRFVQHYRTGGRQKCRCQRDTLPLTGREFDNPTIQQRPDPQPLFNGSLIPGYTVEPPRRRQLLARRRQEQLGFRLVQAAPQEVRPLPRVEIIQRLSTQLDATDDLGRDEPRCQTVEDPQQRTLAGAGTTEQAYHLARIYGEIETPQNRSPAP